jgi:hypothetical protein
MPTSRKLTRLAGLIVLALAVLGTQIRTTSAASVTPDFVSGNPTCEGLGYTYGFKPQPEPPPSGTYTFPDGVNTVTITSDGTYFDWSSTLPIDAVIVKGGPNANVYKYSPEASGDSGLNSPINPNNNLPFAISHIEFCYDYEVKVTKDAHTTFKRTYTWDIDKTADQSTLTLSVGQQFLVNYAVRVDATYTDSDWAVSGNITIYNPDPGHAATITSVTDQISGGIDAAVSCPSSSVPAGGTLVCSYNAALPDAADRTNTATVTTSGSVGGGSGTANVSFAGATITHVDESITVTDDYAGSLGTVTYGVDTLPKTFTYSRWIHFDVCGDYTVDNTASFTTNDTGATGSASWTVTVHVPCAGGCTLTQGYWKTHSDRGPAPYDDGWKQVGALEEDTLFFNSGTTWYEVFWTAPAGNAYYVLAHQYMAAKLNVLNGASSTPAVDAAIAGAEALFNAQGVNDTTLSRAERTLALAYAYTLDQYNNGYIGPGHCSE